MDNYLCEYCGNIKNEMFPYIILTICRTRGNDEIKVCCECSAKLYSNPKYVVKEGSKIHIPDNEKIELYRISKYSWKPKDIRSKEIRQEEKLIKEQGRAMRGILDFDKTDYKVVSKKIKDESTTKVKK